MGEIDEKYAQPGMAERLGARTGTEMLAPDGGRLQRYDRGLITWHRMADAAYGPGAAEPEPVPADPVEWTLSHPDLEILDQREVTVDGVAATQIDARAVNETNWLAVEAKPFGWGGDERVVLIPSGDSWLVVRGSTFDPDASFAEDLPTGDAFRVMLDSVNLPE